MKAVRCAPTPAKRRDAVVVPIIICGDRRSTADNLGWQSVLSCFDSSDRIMVEPLFFENDSLVTANGDTAPRFDTALVSISSETSLLQLASIRSLLPDVKLYGGGFAYASAAAFADALLDGGFAGEFDRFDVSVYERAAAQLAEHERPSIFHSPPAPTIDRMAHSIYMLPESVFPDTYLLEVNRGCPFSCRFCEVPRMRTERYLPMDEILLHAASIRTEKNRIGLMGTALASHPDFPRIISRLVDAGRQLSFSSFRAELLDEESISVIARSGSVTITIAPEAGSERMKSAVGKRISAAVLRSTVLTGVRHGIRRFKFYYIIGIPGEDDSDVLAIADELASVVEAAKEGARERKWMPMISASVNPYIVKKGNASGNERFIDLKTWERRKRLLSNALRKKGGISLHC
ncbi:MAG: radical SAM protein, partial [Spirochaetota bacterium]